MNRSHLTTPLRICALTLAVASSSALAAPPSKDELPSSLREWVPWVLHGAQRNQCPAVLGTQERTCTWPGRLTLVLDNAGGRFSQTVQAFTPETWLPLPGSNRRWPQQVQVDGRPAIVIERGEVPAVQIGVGEHQVAGTFEWDSLPAAIEVPPATGLLSLTVKNQVIAQPNRDSEGRVFLQKEGVAEETDRVDLVVHRHIIDDIPLVVSTRLQLNVSGKSREVLLGRSLPDAFIPMSARSPLPVRIEADGRLRLQVRPGMWVVEFEARHDGPVTTLTRPRPDGVWADDEIWVFEARPSLRQVLVEGVNAVDPAQTTLPAEWKRWPAYAMGERDVMTLTERGRGNSDPAPDTLRLSRTLWLDFDGTGYSVSDAVTGQLHQSWRLDMQPGTELGRVVASGADQSITRRSPSALAGVELRQGALALEADSRIIGPIGAIPAVSWDADFAAVQTTLQLPPGWALVSVSGADSVPGTWVERWSLLDLFLVLVVTVAIGRLFGVPWGALALVTLVLTWHEAGSPRYVWLAVLFGEALVRVCPSAGGHPGGAWQKIRD